MFDVVIAGAGPAGTAAALTLGRMCRTVLLIDAGEGRNARAGQVHNFLTRDGTPPARLRELGRADLAAYPSVRVRAGTVTDATVLDGGFRLDLAGGGTAGGATVGGGTVDGGTVGGGTVDGGTVDARRLLLATGLADDLPGPRGVEALWGRSAFHCPYCHGYECAGKRVAVLGAAPARVRLALQLSRFAADVALCTGGEPLDAASRATLETNGVTVRCEAVARLEGTGDRLEQVVFEGGPPLAREAVFVVNVPRQRSGLAARLGCAAFADGCVEVDEFARTSVPGVYAAGDMARRATLPVPLAAVVAAAAGGTLAGAVIDQDLVGADFGLPDPFARARS
ncbi:NAD(P)/FAD-dependent oxidoreductase [Nonomuraea deserti]|uniref:NAD(P)/FAD-dependent oxidoreductase n=1 Tax=Nonomuraea deserti TaxID=1848322 RepID=A0A4V2YA45_9ACTN|nr:NAD(P)/FAD-dependent oxidoreductase [Nonomuraea deserti]TDD02326.1 NAD(P)/FAD-dependent oxidoreductase [Nonomuraea deserti]